MLGVQDDLTGVVWFSFEGPTADGVPTAWRPDLVSVLRAFHGCPRPDDVVLAAGELVSNAVEHGGGVRRLHVEGRRGVVTVEVQDFRSSLTRLHDVAAKPDGGRGLRIVDEVADSWGWWPTESGKTVWATFRPETQEEK
jgi:anti-sigma regulatory factor (Ser/Thr protein kinase)